MKQTAHRFGRVLFPVAAGIASFLFSLAALISLDAADEKVVAAIALGLFALLVCWIAAERPNTESARAHAALVERLLRVGAGDLTTPTPAAVHRIMPAVGRAVDHLFAQVRASIEGANAIALFDPVTALPNRVHFRREVETLLDARTSDAIAALIFVDLDRFKAVNDTLGHARGDEALVLVADRLRAVVLSERGTGVAAPLAARLAGDEFTLFFPELAGCEDADRIAHRVLDALNEPFGIRGHNFDIGASIGVAVCPSHGCDLDDLMRSSDIAMYQAKSAGRGQVCLFDAVMAYASDQRAATEADLRSGIANDEFELYFQPQVMADTGAVVSVEALLRWHHPRDGLRLPTSFIGVAEECGLIVDLGDWLFDAVGKTLAGWRAAGIDFRLALNISPRQLDRSKFFMRLREAMAHTGADLRQLELELTESATAALDVAVLAELAALRRDGVRIAIDDFGTGYSNLARLQEMPLDHVKIDGSLIAEIDRSENARVVVQAVVQLVHGIGCRAVAEGVERDAQIDLLRLIGCDALQGYKLAEPMPEPALLSWLADRMEASTFAEGGSMPAMTAA